MADFSALIAQIEAYVKQNGNNEITGNGLQSILVGMVNAIGGALNDAVADLQGNDTELTNSIGSEADARVAADNAIGVLIAAINEKIPSEASSGNKLADKAFVTTLTTALQGAVDAINANIGNGYVYAGVATPSGTPVSGKVAYLTAQAGTYTNYGGLVVPTGISVLKYNGTTWSQEQVMSMADIYRNPLMGLFDCSTAGATAAKVATADGYVLPANGGSMKVRMANHTTVDNVTLNINGTGAKTLYYKGKAAGINNTWGDGAILNVMYDSTNSIYLAYDANAGTGDGVFDISDYTGDTYEDLVAALADVPVSERHGGMMVRFIQGSAPSVDNNYVQYSLMAQSFTTDTTKWQGVNDDIVEDDKNLANCASIFKATNRFITVDENKAVSSSLAPVPDGFVVECYIDHKEQSGNDYRLYSIRIDGDSAVIRLTKGSGSYIKTISLEKRTSIVESTFHDNDDDVDVSICFILDWSKVSETLAFGYRYGLFTERCYELRYSPRIYSYLLENRVDFDEKDIARLDVLFRETEQISIDDLTLLGSGYMSNNNTDTVANRMKLMPYNNSTLYYYPVVAGTLYKLSSSLIWYMQYSAVGFCENIPVLGNSYDEEILNSESPIDCFAYTPQKNGYILLVSHSSQKSFVYNVGDIITTEELKKETEDIQSDIENIENTFTDYELVEEGNLVSLGSSYMNRAAGVEQPTIIAGYAMLYYYPVIAGVKYKLSSELQWSYKYSAVGFSQNVPVIGNSYEEIIPADTPTEKLFFVPQTNGYVILCYKSTWKSYINEPVDVSMTEVMHEIEDIKGKIYDYKIVDEGLLTLIGNCYMNISTGGSEVHMKIIAFSGSILYYFPVEAGKKYKLSSNVTGWSSGYASLGFSQNLPAIGNSYDRWLLKADAAGEILFEPEVNGYVLLCYRSGNKSYVAEYTSIDLQKMEEDIKELEKEVNIRSPLKKSIVCSGSSITWGGGSNTGVFDSSMVKFVDKFIKEKLSKTIHASDTSLLFSQTPTDISNYLIYEMVGKMITGLNASVEFDMFGNEIAICQVKRRTASDYGVMKVYADGVEIGTFDNKNTIKSATENFSGESLREIKLSHPCTFNHRIYINGSSTPLDKVVFNTSLSTSASMPTTNCNAWVFRGSNADGSTCHYIQFAESLGTITSVTVEYDYGRIIAHERSTVGQTADEYQNESYYGKGTVSYDPDQPSSGIGSGLEFRAIDKRAFFVHKFDEYKTRHFKIEIVGGSNPYFIFNFATNRYHNLMNAGIGGWQLKDLLDSRDLICHYTQFFKFWHPDILFEEAETNDDWDYSTRRISRSIGEVTLSELQKMHQLEVHKITYNSVTDKYAVEMCTGIISSITPTSLISSDIIGTGTQVGDIIRIGNYLSDMHQIVCRKITEVNLETGEVKWLEPLVADDILMIDDLSDLVGAEINIRDLSGYKALYKQLIEKVHAISPETMFIVVHNGLPNLWTRQLWGYEIIHAELCQEYERTEFINAQEHIYNTMFNTITGARKETVVSTGASSYDLSFAGTQYGGWQGFKVLVNGVDVYGKDAYIEMDMAYRLNTNVSGAAANKTNPYNRSKSGWNRTGAALTLHFIKNIPTSNDTIEVQYADTIWSNDFCHVTDFGAKVYGESYNDILNKLT